MNERVEAWLERFLEALGRSIEERGWSTAELERRLGRPPGWLEDRFRQPASLGLEDLFEVLEAAGVEPEDYFFEATASGPPGRWLDRAARWWRALRGRFAARGIENGDG